LNESKNDSNPNNALEGHPQDNEMQELLRAVEEKYQRDISDLRSQIERYNQILQRLGDHIGKINQELENLPEAKEGKISILDTIGLVLRIFLVLAAFVSFELAANALASFFPVNEQEQAALAALIFFVSFLILVLSSDVISIEFKFKQHNTRPRNRNNE
jgi:hypothetical protein